MRRPFRPRWRFRKEGFLLRVSPLGRLELQDGVLGVPDVLADKDSPIPLARLVEEGPLLRGGVARREQLRLLLVGVETTRPTGLGHSLVLLPRRVGVFGDEGLPLA